MSYSQGEGYAANYIYDEDKQNITRVDLHNVDMEDFYYKPVAGIAKDQETHSGADVGIFASGNVYLLVRHVPFIAKGAVRILH